MARIPLPVTTLLLVGAAAAQATPHVAVVKVTAIAGAQFFVEAAVDDAVGRRLFPKVITTATANARLTAAANRAGVTLQVACAGRVATYTLVSDAGQVLDSGSVPIH